MKFSSVSLPTDSSLNGPPTPSPHSNGKTLKCFGIQNIYFQNYIPQRSKTHNGEPAGDLAEGEEGGVGEIAAESPRQVCLL